MARGEYRTQIRERVYTAGPNDQIKVAEINPRARQSNDDYEEQLLRTRTQQIASCMFATAKKYGSISLPEIQRREFIDMTAGRIKQPEYHSRYVVALQGQDRLHAAYNKGVTVDEVAAYTRVETWRGRSSLGRIIGKKFPVITELGTPSGLILGKYHEAAAAAVHYSLIETDLETPVGLQINEEDREAVDYFTDLGFEIQSVSQTASGYGMTINMMTEQGVDRFDVQRNLESHFPFLASNGDTIA